jgi:hypothetical protein
MTKMGQEVVDLNFLLVEIEIEIIQEEKNDFSSAIVDPVHDNSSDGVDTLRLK